jgi:hypothetical protein
MTLAQEKLLRLLAGGMFESGEKPDLSAEAESVLDEALAQTVALVAFAQVDPTQLPLELRPKLKAAIGGLMQRNMSVNHGHLVLDSLMRGAGIPYTIIKGMASAVYYPDYMMRAMGDVDFLISQADFERANRLLLASGFATRVGERDHHVTYDKDGVRYELHLEPPGIPKGEKGKRLRDALSDTVEKSCRIKGEFGEISVPDGFHHGLIVLLHNLHHLTSDGLGLRHLCDWAVFINSVSADEFSGLFDAVLKEAGLLKFARVMSLLCEEALGCKNVFTDFSDEEKALSNEMLLDIFTGGNFGQKSDDRAHEQVLTSLKNEGSAFVKVIKYLNKVVFSHWKIARKCKILLPFGWAFFGGRYILRSFLGKRPKIRPKNIINEAEKRKEFYKRLKLFEN